MQAHPQSSTQYHAASHSPAAQPPYSTNGISHPPSSHYSQPQAHNSTQPHPQAAEMHPYQPHPYGGGYPQYPSAQQQQQQQPQPQQPQQQQSQQQQQQQQHLPPQQQLPPQQPRQFPQTNQLPPLAAQYGPPVGGVMPPGPFKHDSAFGLAPGHPLPGYTVAAPNAYAHYMHPSGLSPLPPQQAKAGASSQSQEIEMNMSKEKDGLKYTLEVVQQPQRARMCGFGDKDRRPITPPPCVKLVITDATTGKEVPIERFDNQYGSFVLLVELWSETADREANVVRASSSTPAMSISNASTTSYPPPAESQMFFSAHTHQYMPMAGSPAYSMPPNMVVPYGSVMPQPMTGGWVGNPQMFAPNPPNNNAMYTRNLIGSLAVNAARLSDTDGKHGFWFVLQDLSVRTEGMFRLRMAFCTVHRDDGKPGPTLGKSPILARCFSDIFQVYSAKKFPGVIESTPLSKLFASQGIKIPIRKDNKNGGDEDDDGD